MVVVDYKKVVAKLKKDYPEKKIFEHKEDDYAEILCEVEPSSDHPDYSLAVAVIDKSQPHVHKQSRETYKVTKGHLSLYIDNDRHELEEGEELIVEPGQVHWAEGKETWIECYSEPGWQFKDHIIDKV